MARGHSGWIEIEDTATGVAETDNPPGTGVLGDRPYPPKDAPPWMRVGAAVTLGKQSEPRCKRFAGQADSIAYFLEEGKRTAVQLSNMLGRKIVKVPSSSLGPLAEGSMVAVIPDSEKDKRVFGTVVEADGQMEVTVRFEADTNERGKTREEQRRRYKLTDLTPCGRVFGLEKPERRPRLEWN